MSPAPLWCIGLALCLPAAVPWYIGLALCLSSPWHIVVENTSLLLPAPLLAVQSTRPPPLQLTKKVMACHGELSRDGIHWAELSMMDHCSWLYLMAETLFDGRYSLEEVCGSQRGEREWLDDRNAEHWSGEALY